MKRSIFKIHSYLGLLSGIFLLMVGLTGSILVFTDEVDRLFHPSFVRISPGGPRLEFDALKEKIQAQWKDHEIVGWAISKNPRIADNVRLIKHGSSSWLKGYLNPATGEISSPRKWEDTVCGWLVTLHYSLFLEDWGIVFMGVVALSLALSCLSGLIIYRGWLMRILNPFAWRVNRKIILSDTHRLVGVLALFFNLILAGTGAYWNLPALKKIGNKSAESIQPSTRLFSNDVSVDELLEKSKMELAGFSATYIEFPRQEKGPFVIWGSVPSGNLFSSKYGSTVSFDSQAGGFIEKKDIRQVTWWQRCEDMMGPLHFGTFGGLPVKVLWSLGGLTPGALGITGFLLWRRRRAQLRNHRRTVENTSFVSSKSFNLEHGGSKD